QIQWDFNQSWHLQFLFRRCCFLTANLVTGETSRASQAKQSIGAHNILWPPRELRESPQGCWREPAFSGETRHVHHLQRRTCRCSNNRRLRRRVRPSGRLKGLSGLRGNSHDAFLGGGAAVMSPCYPAIVWSRHLNRRTRAVIVRAAQEAETL